MVISLTSLAVSMAMVAAPPAQASAGAPRHVTLKQAFKSLPATVQMLSWTLHYRGAFQQSINLAPCEDGAQLKAGPYVHAEYDGPAKSNDQHAGLVIVVVFAAPADAAHALARLTSQARHCPRRYSPPYGGDAVNTTVSRRSWGPDGWRGFLITGTSLYGDEHRRTEGEVDVYATRGNVLVEVSTGDDLRTASLARQGLWGRSLATAMINGLDRYLQ